MRRLSLKLLASTVIFSMATSVALATSVRLAFETECLNLDDNRVHSDPWAASIDWHLRIAYNAERATRAVLEHNSLNGTQLALLSGCQPVVRHAHSIDAYGEGRYVPLGRDSSVAFGFRDLVFKVV